MNSKQEAIIEKIISETKNEMNSLDKFLTTISVEPISIDKKLLSNEDLPEEIVFKVGLSQIIFLVVVVSLFGLPIFYWLFVKSEKNGLEIFFYFLFAIIFLGAIVVSNLHQSRRGEKIVVAKNGLFLSYYGWLNWSDIEGAYIKQISQGKNVRRFLVVALKNGFFREQEYISKSAFKSGTLEHYIALYLSQFGTPN